MTHAASMEDKKYMQSSGQKSDRKGATWQTDRQTDGKTVLKSTRNTVGRCGVDPSGFGQVIS